ncbi:hypothetical protein [Neobacillus mesonae]|uniref:LD-carboxypeptidase N-terminal domain-containing protein n=1 Tax=Neobacillus mesonae TaxID=1193713 RepID=A0A3T0HTL4_9BACI|nr:hypothetical protein [Neobacillus mesonae]AZU60318.1 hypothetical protein CHR53_03005 [Neobacillus mesonae]
MATRPKALQRGDTVGIVTLASPYPSEYINQAVATLEKSGFQVVGIIIGECTDCIEAYGKSWDDVIHDFLVPLGSH